MVIERATEDYDYDISKMRIRLKSFKDLRDKKDFNPPSGSIRQKFIVPKSGHKRIYAQIHRVCFHTRNNPR